MDNTDIRYLKGIGEKKARAFERLGIRNASDLLSFFPRRYEDRSLIRNISEIFGDETVCIQALVADTPRLSRVRKGMDLVKFRAADSTGTVDITYFNQSYVKDQLFRGEEYFFYGKVEVKGSRRSMVNPIYEREGSENRVTGRIMPIYRMTVGLNQKTISSAVRQALELQGETLPNPLPESVRERQGLAQVRYAYENVHFPSDFKALEIARRRLVFEELFVLSCALGKFRGERERAKGIKTGQFDTEKFYASLPFPPTNAQRRAVEDSIRDMRSGGAMNRLLQGDVGSGKTLVAAALCLYMHANGYTSALMAPTEILADQHLATMRAFLGGFGLRIEKLTGSLGAKEKRELKARLANGEIDLIVGTHALFTKDVELGRLGLVITDEQHRFGVTQRSSLIGKGDKPHVLVMSATPIPRTLALIIYGDLDASILDEMPPGRQKVETFAVDGGYRQRLNAFILKQAKQGHQVFVVCPALEENEESELNLKSATSHALELQESLPQLKVECVHGKMKAREKDAIMAAFSSGETDVLVSTTVIEVGVDVPNATLMIVENAERFGLSQLHQLRGRVGRGEAKSYCVLVSDYKGEDVKARLDILCKTNDGFKISEEDLRLRGPGDFFGSRQHGLPEMHVADLGADTMILKLAQDEASRLLREDPGLEKEENRALRHRVEQLFSANADSFN